MVIRDMAHFKDLWILKNRIRKIKVGAKKHRVAHFHVRHTTAQSLTTLLSPNSAARASGDLPLTSCQLTTTRCLMSFRTAISSPPSIARNKSAFNPGSSMNVGWPILWLVGLAVLVEDALPRWLGDPEETPTPISIMAPMLEPMVDKRCIGGTSSS